MAQGYYYHATDLKIAERCEKVGKKLGVTPIQIALAWILSKPGMTAPVIGASKSHHLPDAIAALEVKLSDADIKTLEEPYQPDAVMGHVWSLLKNYCYPSSSLRGARNSQVH